MSNQLVRTTNRLLIEGIFARIFTVVALVVLLGISALPHIPIDAISSAETAAASGDTESATENYQTALLYHPADPAILLSQANMFQLSGGHEQAVQLYRQAEEIRPLSSEDYLKLGGIYASAQQTNEAVAAWETALVVGREEGRPLDTAVFDRLVEGYIALGDWAGVEAVLAALVTFEPDNPQRRVELGLVRTLNESPGADTAFAEAVSLDPTLAQPLSPIQAYLQQRSDFPPDLAFLRLGTLYLTLDELQLAEEAFHRAVLINPAYGEALAYQAYTKARMGQPALAAVQQAIALTPDEPNVYFVAGLTWSESGAPYGARALFEQAYDLDPANPAIAVEIAGTHRAEGAPEFAEVWMLEAVRLAPDDPRFQILLAQFYVDEEYRVEERGLPLARDLANQFPDSAEVRATFGRALLASGSLTGAEEQLGLAIMLNFRLARAQFDLGTVYELQGDIPSARRQYETTLSLDPDGPFGQAAARALERLN